MKRTAATLILSAVMLCSSGMGHAAASPRDITIELNGQPLKSTVSSYIDNGTTLVPLSLLSSLKGFSVHWLPDEGVARLWMDRGGIYDFKPGTDFANDWGIHYPLGARITMKKGNIMLPLRFIAEMAGADVIWNKKQGRVGIIQKHTAIASVPGGKNRLFAAAEKDGRFTGIRMEWDGLIKTYPWVNPSNIVSPPRLFIEDISGDGKPEAVVMLNVGRGTGLFLEEIRVIDRKTFREVPVEDPLEIVKSRVVSTIEVNEQNIIATLSADGKKSVITLDASSYEADKVFKKIQFGAIIAYAVKDKKLIAKLSGASGIENFVGDLEISYVLEDGQYVADSLTFSPYD